VSEATSLLNLIVPGPTSSLLAAAGLSETAAAAKARLIAQSARALLAAGAHETDTPRVFFVPGRIEVLGKHTDYAGGRSIVAAAERGFCLVVLARGDERVRIIDAGRDETAAFEIGADLEPDRGDWTNYPMTVARRLARNFPGPLCGAQIAFASDLPPAAGMSSSSAMVVAFHLALSAVNGLSDRDEYKRNITGPEALAEYMGTIENGQDFGELAGDRGVGTFGGSEDHTAILTCRPGQLRQYSYCPVRLERALAVPAGYVFAVGASGAEATKTGEAMVDYNRASRLASTAAEVWRWATGRDDPHLAAALASGDDAAQRLREMLQQVGEGEFTADELVGRFEHFLAESEQIIPAAGDALAAGDLAAFGAQVDRSQELADTLLGNQVPATTFLARSARSLGAVAASAFGAGYGGGVWALVEAASADELLERWTRRYRVAFPELAEGASFFTTPAGPGAFELQSSPA